MTDNYARIVRSNLKRLYLNLPPDLDRKLPARQSGERFEFDAFGAKCEIRPDGIFLDAGQQDGPVGILLSLYALGVQTELCVPEPFKAFKDFPNSMPYAGAFVTHTQQILVPYVESIEKNQERIVKNLKGRAAPAGVGGDFAFVVYPLPKIALCYIFYLADDDFQAAVTCLYSSNAGRFLAIDALADVGEYTSKKILDLCK
ncbi:MAG: DUF3786 domain-containing protein [Candidatus Desulfatibia sp.]|uniref:DUF3786 domain-containing protein n=1 Tax=Candidatus Desulfatibia sp. TaxID=3101189 RepID=UPI002F32DFE6